MTLQPEEELQDGWIDEGEGRGELTKHQWTELRLKLSKGNQTMVSYRSKTTEGTFIVTILGSKLLRNVHILVLDLT